MKTNLEETGSDVAGFISVIQEDFHKCNDPGGTTMCTKIICYAVKYPHLNRVLYVAVLCSSETKTAAHKLNSTYPVSLPKIRVLSVVAKLPILRNVVDH